MAAFNNMFIQLSNDEIYPVMDLTMEGAEIKLNFGTYIYPLHQFKIIDFEKHYQQAYDMYNLNPKLYKSEWFILRTYRKIHNIDFIPVFNF